MGKPLSDILNKKNIKLNQMKKILFILGTACALIAGLIFTGCQTSTQKEEAAKEKVQDAKEDLKEVQKDVSEDANKAASAEEWKIFRNETEIKISKNENRIAELKIKMKKPGKILDPLYEKRIDVLEQRNRDLKAKMDAYEKNQSDWESFKREFNHDMDDLGQSLENFTVNNDK
jgi:chromosome segregation ATPase